MDYLLWVFILVFLLLIFWYYLNYKRFVKKAKLIWDSNRDLILNEIDSISDDEITSCLYFKSEELDTVDNIINIPEFLNNKWKGKTLELLFPKKLDDAASENVVEVIISNRETKFTQIGNTRFFCIKTPRVKLKNGKNQNLYSATKFIQKSDKLKDLYKDFKGYKKYEALDLFLTNPLMLFSSPKWYQQPRHLKCPICKEKMILVVQIPGYYLAKNTDKIFGHGDIYIFSCNEHIENFKSVIDIT